MAKLSPVFNEQTVDINGSPMVGAKVFTYVAGSSTKVATYTDAAGTIPQTNPIILDSLGYPTNGSIWIAEGTLVKFVLAPPTDTDPPTSPIKTIDNVQGVNDSSTTISQWTASGVTPTYVNATTFTLVGDQTSAFHPGRREQFTVSAGTVYGSILSSAYTGLTTVVMTMDPGQILDAGLSVVNHSILLTSPTAIPSIFPLPVAFAAGSTVPTAPQFDDDLEIVNSAFVRRESGSLAGLTAITSTTTLTLAQLGTVVGFNVTTVGQIVTLPAFATVLKSGYGYWIRSTGTQPFTLKGDGAELIALNVPGVGQVTANTAIIYPGDSFFLCVGATSWIEQQGVRAGNQVVASATVASTSGTAIDFTGIPAWVKRITISLSGVSLSGADGLRFQLGDSGGIETSGYLCAVSQLAAVVSTTNPTSGFDTTGAAATSFHHGSIVFTRVDSATNAWAANGAIALSDTARTVMIAGSKALSATLDRVRVAVTGANTFDAGLICILYE